MAEAIHAEIDRLKKEDISDDELKMIRTRAKANLLRGLGSNEGLASHSLCIRRAMATGASCSTRWTNLDKVSKADIRRIANQTFVPTNRTVGIIETDLAPATSGRAKRRWAMKRTFLALLTSRLCWPALSGLPGGRPGHRLATDQYSAASRLSSPGSPSASCCPTAW